MSKFFCDCCSYKTSFQTNMTRHNKSDKHIANSIIADKNKTEKHTCDSCHKNFMYKSGLSRHKKTCFIDNVNVELKTQLLEMQSKIDKMELQTMRDQIKNQQDKIELLLGYKNIAENTTKSSCSALNYIIKNYNNAPCIQQFTKFDLLTEGNEDYSIAEIAIHKYNQNQLCSYIGDIIVSEYKTDDPARQTFWTSDVNRLAYLIREVTINNKVEWLADKGGIKLSTYIIKPILDHIDNDLARYYDEKLEDLDLDINEADKTLLRNKMIAANSIRKIIENNQLNNDIIKYIAKYLHLDRKTNAKLITHDESE